MADNSPTDAVTLDDLTDMETMPEISQHVIDAQSEKSSSSEMTDSGGTVFDSTIHLTDSGGNPVKTKLGRFRKRTIKNDTKSTEKSTVGILTKKPDPNIPTAETMALGATSAAMTVTVGTIIGGDEWRPKIDAKTGVDEMAMLTAAYTSYYHATGKRDFPPGVALAVAIIGYAAPRFSLPKTRTRVVGIVGYIRGWWTGRQKKPAKIEEPKTDEKVEQKR